MTRAELGRLAYDTYSVAVGGRSVKGEPLPAYDGVRPEIQRAWEITGATIAETVLHTGYEPALLP